MTFLYILSYISTIIQICFITIAIAAGLYYLAELVEEYTVIAKKIISWLVIFTTSIYVLFIFVDDLPWTMVLCGLTEQLFHFIIMKDFPYVEFFSFSFLGAVLLLIINHILAFREFATIYYPFSEVMAYFTLCLWLVPFALFISLSANNNVLPTTVNEQTPLLDNHDVVTNYFSKKGKKLGLLTFFNYAKESILPQRVKKSF
ncbi:protein TEX261 [Condylostylus longicornis]|uniref:protein TEX261 n=1 Tax=Condylostylus longicornis TaxID=2530218 RepID=UPI00244E3096|nr:protein TEX261 [Condylostylus longicornis]